MLEEINAFLDTFVNQVNVPPSTAYSFYIFKSFEHGSLRLSAQEKKLSFKKAFVQ